MNDFVKCNLVKRDSYSTTNLKFLGLLVSSIQMFETLKRKVYIDHLGYMEYVILCLSVSNGDVAGCVCVFKSKTYMSL